jgi:hypothetical protein
MNEVKKALKESQEANYVKEFTLKRYSATKYAIN